MSIPAINIYGMGLDYMLTFIYLTVANYICVKRFTGVRISWHRTVVKPLIATAVMGVVTSLVYRCLLGVIGNFLAMIIAFAAAVAVYAVMIILTGAISDEEIAVLPGHRRIVPLYRKLLHWRQKVFKA